MTFGPEADEKLEEIQSMCCPSCKKTGELGYSFVTGKFDCNNCGHQWILLYLIIKTWFAGSKGIAATAPVLTTLGYVYTKEEAEKAVLKLAQETKTTYDSLHEKFFPAFHHQKICLSHLTKTDVREEKRNTAIERAGSRIYCNKCFDDIIDNDLTVFKEFIALVKDEKPVFVCLDCMRNVKG